ncbi:LOW QUALITY PROTEIN: E3 ubiquitin-protein ligase Mdm2 [Spinachia spinachia]
MSADGGLNSDTADDNKLVRPKLEFRTLLHHAGATKEVFTMKEVMFYLGQYIILKQLYDQKQQHIVHCSQDALGRVLGVESFSVKEPRVLFAMISKNLVAVKSQETAASSSGATSAPQTEEADSERHSPERRGRRRRRSLRSSSEPGGSSRPSDSSEGDKKESQEEQDDDDDGEVEGRKRRRSDSYSLTFDESLSWCVIGGLASVRDRHSSQSSDSLSTSGRSEVTAAASDSDSDHFSVEFEVESVDSDDYDEDDASLSADDQIYEVTIFEAEESDCFDEDTEITEADYWRCTMCEELNPPLPRNCLRCWELRQDWLSEVSVDVTKPASSSPKALPPKPTDQSAAKDSQGSDVEENDGVDVPDGKRVPTPPPSHCHSDTSLCSSQPSSMDSQDPAPPPAAAWQLPESCLDPCLICQSRPKNGCIVHGRTGHLMCCYVCARKLKKRNKLCPVCRLPIESVVLTYVC